MKIIILHIIIFFTYLGCNKKLDEATELFTVDELVFSSEDTVDVIQLQKVKGNPIFNKVIIQGNKEENESIIS